MDDAASHPAMRLLTLGGGAVSDSEPLHLYEEILLLALRNKQGTVATDYSEYVIAGAVLAELLLERRIALYGTRKHLVDIRITQPTGDPIIDECLEVMKAGRKRASLQKWVSRLAGIKRLRHKVARQLCDRGVLSAGEDKVLYIFTRKIYPEIDPVPEQEIVERLWTAIFTDSSRVEPRTVVLISLANAAGLLAQAFGRKEVKSRKKRIEHIVSGELAGQATKEVIAACETALIIACVMPVIIASPSS
jgi:golgi phosphoprotein 3